VTLTKNTITGNERGLRLGEPNKTPANVGPTNVEIHRNNISGNTSEAMTNVTQTTADAECNWWGSASGPSATPGTSSYVGPGVDFKPWLRSSNLDGNCPPEAVDDSASTNEDNAVNIAVLANDHDFEGSTLTPTNVSDPPNGSVAVQGNGTITYTPDANYNGPDSFTYTASDGTDASDPATVSITVSPVNDAPVANNDGPTTTAEDTAASGNVLTNDTDVDTAPGSLTAVKVTEPSHGTVSLDADGDYTYTPAQDYNGTDSFTYKVNDGAADSNTATVSFTVTPVNDAPVANDDNPPEVEMNGTLDSDTTDAETSNDPVLANDTDVDSAHDDLTAELTDNVDHGTLIFQPEDGSYSYTPATGYSGPDEFKYKAKDPSNAESNEATVSITVTPANNSPTAFDDSAATDEDTPLTVPAPGVLANDTDPENDPLTAAKSTDPANGTVTVASNGSYTYTPNENFNGTDSFRYTASDSEDPSNEATVTITVNPVNDAPAAGDDDRSVGEDSGSTALDVRSNDSDAESDPITVESASDPDHGSTALTGGDVSYAPDANYCGSDTFTYTLNGGDTATVSVSVLCADDAPTAADDSKTVAQGSPATDVGVLANDPDPDGGPKQVTSATQASNGTTVVTESGITYRPDPLYCNSQPGGSPDTFTYTVNGGSQATVSMTVTCGGARGEGEDTERPVVTSARVTPKTFAVNPRGAAEPVVKAGGRRRTPRGTTFVYRLSESARVVFTIERRVAGRRVGSRCQRPTARNRRRRACTRLVEIGSFAAAGDAGTNRKTFSGRIGRRSLAPGSYRATLVAIDAAGNQSRAKRLSLKVVRRR
jgi:VCBS repeat-containing protein